MNSIRDSLILKIHRKIADGGMGSVYEAVQEGANGFQKRVAVKTLLPQLSRNLRFVEMFIGEAKLVADLVHENIVQILQLGRTIEGYYIVMEYVNGLSLHEFIRFHAFTQQPIPEHLAVFITSRIARGLAYAHSRVDDQGKPMNIVHRDVCPNNVLITTEGLPKLTDFGIAKARRHVMSNNDRSLMGKLGYMSPEQAQRRSADFRADHFSLGAVLFEMVTCEKIRKSDDSDELLELAAAGTVNWSVAENREIGGELMTIMQRCLADSRGDRYDSTQELARDLEYYIYKDGYGPTIKTLEDYLAMQFPYLYRHRAPDSNYQPSPTPVADSGAEACATLAGQPRGRMAGRPLDTSAETTAREHPPAH